MKGLSWTSFPNSLGGRNYLKVYNKTDLGNFVNNDVFDCRVSAKTGEGFNDGLKKILFLKFV